MVHISGERMGESKSEPLSSEVAPGDEVDVTIPLTAPSEAGTYKGDWQLCFGEGRCFGPELYVIVIVGE